MKYPNLTGKELIAWLVANKQEILDAKKATVKFADSIGTLVIDEPVSKSFANKDYLFEDDVDNGTLKRTIIANTYYYMDSHDDVHLDGIFTNSIEQRKARPQPHLFDHEFSVLAKVGKSLNYTEREISWRELGLGKTGKTKSLFLETEVKRSYNEKVFDAYLDGAIDQHSVGMRYIKIALAVNDEEQYPNEYKVWKEIISKIGNRSYAESKGYFYAVYEAALLETSAVLEGSNVLTPTLNNKSEPDDIQDLVKIEPPLCALNKSFILDGYLK